MSHVLGQSVNQKLDANEHVLIYDSRMTSQTIFLICVGALLCIASWTAGKRSALTYSEARFSADLAAAQAQISELRARLAEENNFHALLGQSQAQASQNDALHQQQLMRTLLPINEGLKLLQTSLTSMERQHAAQFGALDQHLQWARQSEELLRHSTQELTRTLSHAPLRGSWGEAQLRSLVESAGLLEHVHFNTQVSTAQRTKRPDMVVLLPEDKCIPIDAKVPLDAFLRAQAKDVEPAHEDHSPEDSLSYEQLMAQHAKSMRRHVNELSRKEYWKDLPHCADYVIAFIPSESILSAALRYDSSLMHDALNQNVVLASPTSLWAILRTVSYTWRQENLSTHAQEIIQLSQELYERLQTLGKHASKVSSALNNAALSWNSFLGSYESRALVSARRLSGIQIESEPIEKVQVRARSLSDTLSAPTVDVNAPTHSIS